MSNEIASHDDLVNALFEVGAFRFDGPFMLKSGILSPFYVDLRILVSKPDLLAQIASAMLKAVGSIAFDVVCGVPYTALPIATAISLQSGVPMVVRRKEGAKSYGTKKQIEGIIVQGQTCLIIEDLVTSGLSVFETIEPIESQKLRVTDVVVILDRGQGGRAKIEKRGVRLHSLMTISHVLESLLKSGKISRTQYDQSRTFIESNQFSINAEVPAKSTPSSLTYGYKAKCSINSKLRSLFDLMQQKESNLCLSADLTSCSELLHIADQLGPFICMIKTHVDILEDFTAVFSSELRRLAQFHQFMIWEDRKFADIGNTVLHQFTGGTFKIAEWADFVSVHSVSGPGIIQALKKGAQERDVQCQGAFMLAQMSSEGSIMNESYSEATVSMSKGHYDFICGYISQNSLLAAVCNDPGVIQIVPGVQLQGGIDALGQVYRTPDEVIGHKGADIIVVGRGITAARDRMRACKQYRTAGWEAYQNRTSSQ